MAKKFKLLHRFVSENLYMTIIVGLMAIFLPLCRCRFDKTLEINASGNHVVKAAIRKIQDSCIFPNDYQFLLRLAHVENSLSSQAFPGKSGLWNLHKANFKRLTVFKQQYPEKYRKIIIEVKAKFNTDIDKLSWDNDDLRIPFNALLATRMFLEFIEPEISFAVEKQAKLWQNYSGTPTPEVFIENVNKMPATCESAGADILFMLDSSASQGEDNFDKMRRLVKTVVQGLSDVKHKYQFAVDIFGYNAKHPIPFNGYSDISTLLEKINKLKYLAEGTRTDLALLEALKISFTNTNGARNSSLGFPKVVILITDGGSTYGGLTAKASEQVKLAGIEIFTVGIGEAFHFPENKKELVTVSSHPKCMRIYAVKDFESLLQGFHDEIEHQTCHTSAKSFANQSNIDISAGEDLNKYFKFAVDIDKGAFLRFGCSNGSAVLYLSSIENPDGALYDYKLNADYKLTADSTKEGKLYLSPDESKELLKYASSEQTGTWQRGSKTKLYLYASVVSRANAQCKLSVFLENPEKQAKVMDETPTQKTPHAVTDKTTHPVTNKTTQVVTDKTTQAVTEKTTQTITEKTTHAVTDKTTNVVTDKTTHPVTEKTTHTVTEKTTHPVTQKTTHPVTDKTTHTVTQRTTHPVTQRTTRVVTVKASHALKTTHAATDKTTRHAIAKETQAGLVNEWCHPPADYVCSCCRRRTYP